MDASATASLICQTAVRCSVHTRRVSQYCTPTEARSRSCSLFRGGGADTFHDWIDKRLLLVGTAAVGAKRPFTRKSMNSQLGNYLILFRWVSPQLDPLDGTGPQFRGR
jgi:hypothetical protein